MNRYSYKEIVFENRFWLQILGDHSRVILSALAPSEENLIEKCKYFRGLFDKLLDNARKELPGDKVNELTLLAYKAAHEFRTFKLYILSKQLTNKITFNLSPTFINHMLNEIDEYLQILNCYMNKQQYSVNSIHHHLLWLTDGAVHAEIISATTDMTEKETLKLSNKFAKTFKNLYLKAIEFNGYTRAGLIDFPALDKLDEDANSEITCFKQFLEKVKILVIEKKLIGTINPLIPDHMLREECYYQTKLALVSKIKKPECEPTKPRVNA